MSRTWHRLALSAALVAVVYSLSLNGCELNIHIDGTRDEAADARLEMISMPSSSGWILTFAGLTTSPSQMRVQVGAEGEFRQLRTPTLTLDSKAKAVDITFEYTIDGTLKRRVFRFDPAAATLKFSKDTIDMVRTQWVSWRNYGGRKLVYFTFLHMHACALQKVEYGFSGNPDRVWPLPACQGATMTISADDNVLLYAPPEAKEIVVRLTFVDGESWTERFVNDALPE